MADDFEWDEEKRAANIRARGVDFRRAVGIFRGPIFEIEDNRSDYGETRWRALGEVDGESFLVVYTWRGDMRRIISAWRLGKDGRRRYKTLLGRRDRSHDRGG